MTLPNVHRARVAALVAALLAASCTTRSQPSDSSTTGAAVRGDSIGDLTGAPRAADSLAKPAPVSRAPAAPARDTAVQRRNDGSMMNPPIHRTNPRDDDIMRPSAPGAGTGQPRVDLLAEISALAKPEGCASAGDCRMLPVGRKACGGPRTYIVFCPKSTDVAALRAKIAELDRVDLAAAKNTVSDCMMVLPPRPALVGGVCRGTSPTNGVIR